MLARYNRRVGHPAGEKLLVRVTARKVWVSLGSGYPYAGLFAAVYRALRPPGPATV